MSELQWAIDRLVAQGCHTVMLYGSRARGDAQDNSDYDLAGFSSVARSVRDSCVIDGRLLDAFIYPEATPASELPHLRNAEILVQNGTFGTSLQTAIQEHLSEPPPPMPPDERTAWFLWLDRMLLRIQRSDPEAHYRRAWLLFDLLESYFRLRRIWYFGPKESFLWLEANDPQGGQRFAVALRPQATQEEIEALVEHVRLT